MQFVLADTISSKDRAFFENKIRPVLVKYCYECHSQNAKEIGGKLKLDSPTAMIKGGESGPVLVAGDPENSLLIQALRYQETEMPPNEPLPETVVNDFVKWVELGAPDPRVDSKQPSPKKATLNDPGLWSFHPRKSPKVPQPNHKSWAHDPIDHFIMAKLEANQLEPTSDATATELVRRVYIDLIGLPPTFKEVETFKREYQKNSKVATSDLIDELLSRPQFGERWARHWLDVARYGESNGDDGLGRNASFPFAWRYRNYVIDSMNQDVPYDHFISQQIAGDLLPYKTASEKNRNLIATGFLAIGSKPAAAMNSNFQMDIVDDQINVVSTAVLGLSVACARCHDHKHDPIPTRDYYAMAGLFNSTTTLYGKAGNEKLTAPPTPLHGLYEKLEDNVQPITKLTFAKQFKQDIQKLIPSVNEPLSSVPDTLKASETITFSKEEFAMVKDASLQGNLNQVKDSYSVSFWFKNQLANNARPITAYLFSRAKFKDKENAGDHLGICGTHIKDRMGKLFLFNGNQNKQILSGKTLIAKGTWNHVTLIRDKNQVKLYLNGSTQPEIQGTLPATFGEITQYTVGTRSDQFAPLQGNIAGFAAFARALTLKEVQQVHAASGQAVIQATQPFGWAMGVKDKPAPVNSKIHINGDGKKKGPEVPRGFLTAYQLLKLDQSQQHFSPEITLPKNQSGRLQLAKWITHPDHPQTARVLVNRIWLHLFGHTIVSTPDDFGIYGSRPSHPELLDHLANRFIENKWSIKQTIRQIMLTRTYQLSSQVSEPLYHADPENRLFARHLRRRMDAESIRDSILAVANLLDRKQPKESDIHEIDKLINWPPGESTKIHKKSNHRSIYLCMLRHAPPPSLAAFDLPTGVEVTGVRQVTTSPSHSLFLFNNSLVIRSAEKLAQTVKEQSSNEQEKIRFLYRQIYSRDPDSIEVNRALDYLESIKKSLSQEDVNQVAWTSLCQAMLAANEFRYID